jgi:hypothetical protein
VVYSSCIGTFCMYSGAVGWYGKVPAISSVGEKSHRREVSLFGCLQTDLSLVTPQPNIALSLPLPPRPPIGYSFSIGVLIGEQPVTRVRIHARRRLLQTAKNSLLILKREPHGPSHMHDPATAHLSHHRPCSFSSERCGRHFWPSLVSAFP